MSYIDRTSYIHKFGNDIWYVNGVYGDDNYSGIRPNKAFSTIGYALYIAEPGDAIHIATGTYDENRLEINKDDIEIWSEVGVILIDSTGGDQTLLISGDRCNISGVHIHQSGQNGLVITGEESLIDSVHTHTASSSFIISGIRNRFQHCHIVGSTVCGFNVYSASNVFHHCSCIGSGGSTRGYYLSNSGADHNLFTDCVSAGNSTAGYEVVSGAEYNVFKDCASGGSDGKKIDLGSRTQWANFVDRLPRENHEHIYPNCDGEGTPCGFITINNISGDETGTSSDRYYWGEPKVIVPVGDITDIWTLLGYSIAGSTTATEMQASLYRINSSIVGSKYTGGGDQDWDEGETALTLTNATEASKFEVDDLVWIVSSAYTDGEIVRVTDVTGSVVTIERETVNSGRTGLRWDHTTNGTGEKMYLVGRETNRGMHCFCFNWSCASSKDFETTRVHFAKELKAEDGLLIRMMNISNDSDSEFDINIMYVM